MNNEEVQAKIIQWKKIEAQVAELEGYRSVMTKQIMDKIPPELKIELDALKVECDTTLLVKQIATIKAELEEYVLQTGSTAKVDKVGQVIFNNPRVTWDTAGLDGLMVAVPQLAQFRKMGKPYVSFR